MRLNWEYFKQTPAAETEFYIFFYIYSFSECLGDFLSRGRYQNISNFLRKYKEPIELKATRLKLQTDAIRFKQDFPRAADKTP